MRIRFSENGAVTVTNLNRLAGRLEDPSEVLADIGAHMVNSSVPANFQAGGRPAAWARSEWSSQQNQVDTSRLLRSVQARVHDGRLEVGTNVRYARIRQLGGEIKPRRAKAIAVPLPGVARSMRRPSAWRRLSYLPPKSGDADSRGVLARTDRRGRVIPVFLLRARVIQPARPFLLWQEADIAYVGEALARTVAR